MTSNLDVVLGSEVGTKTQRLCSPKTPTPLSSAQAPPKIVHGDTAIGHKTGGADTRGADSARNLEKRP